VWGRNCFPKARKGVSYPKKSPSDSNCPSNIETSCLNAIPFCSVPDALRAWPQTMFPLLTLFVRANNNIRCFPTFNPINQTQQDVMIRPVESVREDTTHNALSNPPSARSAQTVPHAGDHEKTVKVTHLCQIATSVRAQSGTALCLWTR